MVAYNQIAIESLQQAVSIALEGLRRHVEAHGIAYSEDLAQNLKNELEKQVPSRIWRIPENHLLSGEKLRNELAIAVDDARLLAMNEAKSEIDLYVTKMQSQRSSPTTATAPPAVRELEKDFKILFLTRPLKTFRIGNPNSNRQKDLSLLSFSTSIISKLLMPGSPMRK